MLDDLALFVAIVEAGTLQAAADRAGLPPATVTRRLQALERRLGCRLLHRSARRMQLTTEGAQYYEQCRPLVHALRQATQRLDAALGTVAGHIRVLAPVNLASGPLTAAWAGFLQRYPEVTLELELSNAVQDLVGSGADLAIRVGALEDSGLMQRRIGSTSLVLVAAPDWLRRHGTPGDPRALADCEAIVSEPLRQWTLRAPDGAVLALQPRPRFRANEMNVAIAMAEAGLGILMCPRLQCTAALEAGRLVEVLPGAVDGERPIHAVWSQERYLPARVKALLDHLVEFMRPRTVGEVVS